MKSISVRQIETVLEAHVNGQGPAAIAKETGLPHKVIGQITGKGRGLAHEVEVKKAIVQRGVISKEEVLSGVLQAIDLAKLKGEPAVMIQGWARIAKMLGYDAPDQLVSLTAKIHSNKLSGMSNADLERIIEGEIVQESPSS